LKPENGVLKSKFQKNKTATAFGESKPKGVKPKVMVNQKLPKPHLKAQEVKSKNSSTNPKGPIKQLVPKSEIVNTADMPKSKNHGIWTLVSQGTWQERSQCSSPSQ